MNKNFFCLVFVNFLTGNIHSSACEIAFTDHLVEPMAAFVNNFRSNNLKGENQFIIVRGNHGYLLFIGKVIEQIDDTQILADIIDSSSGTIFRKVKVDIQEAPYSYTVTGVRSVDSPEKWTIEDYRDSIIEQENIQFKHLFTAASSTKKKVNARELTLPERTREEELLKQQGYSAFWIRGLKEVNEWRAMRDQFIKLGVNPRTTHIDYFADKIPEHIEHIRKGISAESRTAHEQQKSLEHLEKEARRAVQETRVTYEWWIKFNLALSKVLSPNYHEILSQRLEDILQSSPYINLNINLFPLEIMLPTTTEKFGIIALNNANPYGIHPVGLTNNKKVLHTKVGDPFAFFQHDIRHMNLTLRRENIHSAETQKQLYDFLREVTNISVEQRKNIELIYFVLIHEGVNPDFIITSPQFISSYSMDPLKINQITAIFKDEFSKFIDLPLNLNKLRQKVEESVKDFIDVLNLFYQTKEE